METLPESGYVSLLIQHPHLGDLEPVIEEKILSSGIADFDLNAAEVPGHDVYVIYIDHCSERDAQAISGLLHGMFDVIDNDFSAWNHPELAEGSTRIEPTTDEKRKTHPRQSIIDGLRTNMRDAFRWN